MKTQQSNKIKSYILKIKNTHIHTSSAFKSDSECNLKYKTNVTIFPGTQSMSQVKIAWSKPWWCFNHDPNSCTNPIVVPDALGNVDSVGFVFVPAVSISAPPFVALLLLLVIVEFCKAKAEEWQN